VRGEKRGEDEREASAPFWVSCAMVAHQTRREEELIREGEKREQRREDRRKEESINKRREERCTVVW
jgi:hypothetical protein